MTRLNGDALVSRLVYAVAGIVYTRWWSSTVCSCSDTTLFIPWLLDKRLWTAIAAHQLGTSFPAYPVQRNAAAAWSLKQGGMGTITINVFWNHLMTET